jgi:hypothetical protein
MEGKLTYIDIIHVFAPMNRKNNRIGNYFLEKCFFVLAKTDIASTFAPLFQER